MPSGRYPSRGSWPTRHQSPVSSTRRQWTPDARASARTASSPSLPSRAVGSASSAKPACAPTIAAHARNGSLIAGVGGRAGGPVTTSARRAMPARSTAASCSVRWCSAASTRASSATARRSARTTARASSAVRVAGTTPRPIASSSEVTSRLAASSPTRATRTRGARSVPSGGSGPSGSSTVPVRACTQTTSPWLSATASPFNSTTPRLERHDAGAADLGAVGVRPQRAGCVGRRRRSISPAEAFAHRIAVERNDVRRSARHAEEHEPVTVGGIGGVRHECRAFGQRGHERTRARSAAVHLAGGKDEEVAALDLPAGRSAELQRARTHWCTITACDNVDRLATTSAPMSGRPCRWFARSKTRSLTPTPAARTGHRWPSARRGCLAARPCPCRARRCGPRRGPSRGDGRRSHRCSPDV